MAAKNLLTRVLAAPDDPALREVYADSLQQAGDPRGAFIAAQVAVEALDPLDARYAPALAAVERAIATHGATWIGPYLKRAKLAEVADRTPIDRLANAKFEGGFLRRIAMQAEMIAKEYPALAAREPIEGIELVVGEGIPDAYGETDIPQSWRRLKVSPNGWFTQVAAILAPGFLHLHALDLAGCDIGNAGVPELPPVRELGLFATQLGDAGARAVIAAMRQVVALDLGQCRITDVKSLAGLAKLTHLERLNLAGNQLAALPALPPLVELGVPQSLATAPAKMPTLRTLALASNKALAASPDLLNIADALVELDLGITSLGDERWTALLAAPCARRLVHLHANGCSLSDKAIAALVASPLDRLVSLDISSNKLTDAALSTLATWRGLANVAHLRIGNNRKLTTKGMAALAASEHFDPATIRVGKLDAAPLRERFGERVSM